MDSTTRVLAAIGCSPRIQYPRIPSWGLVRILPHLVGNEAAPCHLLSM
jgi:hypothetical protein